MRTSGPLSGCCRPSGRYRHCLSHSKEGSRVRGVNRGTGRVASFCFRSIDVTMSETGNGVLCRREFRSKGS